MSSPRSSLTKRACDGCKIRKIRCGGGQPCRSCTKASIKCTYMRIQQSRGPRHLRSSTKYLIEQAQSRDDNLDDVLSAPVSSSPVDGIEMPPQTIPNTEWSRIPIDVLTCPLSIYHVRMYPIWPIVNIEDVVSTLQSDREGIDNENYALATAIASATIAQLRLEQTHAGEPLTASKLAVECLRARDSCSYRSNVNLNSIRISFFLHVYYENQNSGGNESLLYLREAISMAQMMGLHRESTYRELSFEDAQLRRRVLWLLFVTERGVCILHRFPVSLKTNIQAPETDPNDELHVLPAFLKLLNLFQVFEKSGLFDIMQDEDAATPLTLGGGHLDWPSLESLQRSLQDGSGLFAHISDVQKADLCVTRHWMRMILWKISPKGSAASLGRSDQPMSLAFPVFVAKELVGIVSQLPRSAIEAHGLGMELKIYEVANSLADAVAQLAMLPGGLEWDGESRPNYILSRLHTILSTFRGGNEKLVNVLYQKMAELQFTTAPVLPASLDCQSEVHKTKKRVETRCTDQETESKRRKKNPPRSDDTSTNLRTRAKGTSDAYRLDGANAIDPFLWDAPFEPMLALNPEQGVLSHEESGSLDVYDPALYFIPPMHDMNNIPSELGSLSPFWSPLSLSSMKGGDIPSQMVMDQLQDALYAGIDPAFTMNSEPFSPYLA
ncbi:fungal-specific transcription factor domain-containing protein [Aspergillus avenaceus]|uniref:Fungal-specific transcription factor domain-containing protein n=1 Tax=Aspergillus avenaceus TaxID=36643 RepID=A0A5N6U727_ASPAV|nr:fungal-specific transcription factor domain-containing protein [Aspergillus avenaceus]